MILRQHHVPALHRASRHIERNLERRLTLAELARVAALAPHHFHRVFSAAMGEPVQTHVRRLQLERAGFELFTSPRAIGEIAAACGYRTPTGFARAFRRHFGVAARQFRALRDPAALVTAIPADMFRHFRNLPVALNEEPDRRFKSIRRTGALLPSRQQGRAALQQLLEVTPAARNAAIFKQTPDFPPITSPDKLRHDFAFEAGAPHAPSDELIETLCPGGRYAVFFLEGGEINDEVILHCWTYVYLVWAPENRVRIPSFGAYERWRRHAGRPTSVEIHVRVQPLEQ